MKNQYFGDINDYHKYTLLRRLLSGNKLKLLVCWMLTKEDKGPDGKKRAYLNKPKEAVHDPELYCGLNNLFKHHKKPTVLDFEKSNLIPNTTFYSKILEDAPAERSAWFNELKKKASNSDLVFLDPDNGFEVESVKRGRNKSSKYVYWGEIEALWADGKSLLVYQHGKREKREITANKLLKRLRILPGEPFSKAFHTSNVLYLLVAQKKHAQLLKNKILKF